MKIYELSGATLDYWVGRTNGWRSESHNILRVSVWRDADGSMVGPFPGYAFMPSTEWAHGGPIIEREKIEITNERGYLSTGTFGRTWEAQITSRGWWEGDTPLVAAMRAYVASKFGDEVPDEVGA